MSFINNLLYLAKKNGSSDCLERVASSISIRTQESKFTKHIGRILIEQGDSFPLSEKKTFNLQEQINSFSLLVNQIAIKALSKKALGESVGEDLPRYILATLVEGDCDTIDRAYARLLAYTPDCGMGTGFFAHKGGYDFTAMIFVTIIYLFGSQSKEPKLPPAIEDHILNNLLNFDSLIHQVSSLPRGSFDLSCPNTMGMVEESENHTWMILGVLYLVESYKNSLLQDSSRNGTIQDLKERILAFIDYTQHAGFHEVNSRPYIAYTLTPLLVLEAVGDPEIQVKTKELLDYLTYTYALSSYQFKRFPPFCRNADKMTETSFELCHFTSFWKVWTESASEAELSSNGRAKHGCIASLMPYRPSPETTHLMMNKGNGYFVRLGHGPTISPEIYYAGPDFLLSAGGVNCGDSYNIVRPISLILPNTKDLRQTLSLGVIGDECQSLNQTGVAPNFACSRGGFVAIHNEELEAEKLESVIAPPIATLVVIGSEIRCSFKGNAVPVSIGHTPKAHSSDHIFSSFLPKKDHLPKETWRLIPISESTYVVIGNCNREGKKNRVGIMAFFQGDYSTADSALELLQNIKQANPDKDLLATRFQFPNNGPLLTYDIDTPPSFMGHGIDNRKRNNNTIRQRTWAMASYQKNILN